MGRLCWQTCVALAAAGAALGLGSCTSDDYATGDGRYSYLRADFAMMHTREGGVADYALTDDGDSLAFASPYRAGWASRPDTLYRALVYHDVHTHEVFSASPVLVVRAVAEAAPTAPALTDPLDIESAWVAGGYLNMAVVVKTGQATDSLDRRQTLGLMAEPVASASGQPVLRLRLLHGQNGVPQYYSVKTYVSMSLAHVRRGTTIMLTAPTYTGERQYTLSY